MGWFPAGSTLRHARKEGDLTTPDTVSTHPRWEFVGYVAVDEVSQLVGRRINWGNFRGCQNPCVYTNFLKTREQRDSVEADECLTKEPRLVSGTGRGTLKNAGLPHGTGRLRQKRLRMPRERRRPGRASAKKRTRCGHPKGTGAFSSGPPTGRGS